MGEHVLHHDCAGGDHGPSPYLHAADDRRVRPDRCAFTHDSPFAPIAALGVFRPWRQIVREHAGGTAEHVVLQLHSFVNRDVVLDLDPVADLRVRAHVNVLAERASSTDGGTRLDMAEVPYPRALADCHALVSIRALVHVRGRHRAVSFRMFSLNILRAPSIPHWKSGSSAERLGTNPLCRYCGYSG